MDPHICCRVGESRSDRTQTSACSHRIEQHPHGARCSSGDPERPTERGRAVRVAGGAAEREPSCGRRAKGAHSALIILRMDDTFTADNTLPASDAAGEPFGINGRLRPYHRSGRTLRLHARFSGQERAEIEAAAATIGMTATGFIAEAAIQAARGTPMVLDATVQDREALARLQRRLFEARTAVNRFGTNVNQAVAKLHSTGQPPAEDLVHAVRLCTRAVHSLDEVIDEVHRRLR